MPDGRNSDNQNKDNFENFWRPIWDREKEINLDAKWINNIKDTIKTALPPISSEPITVREDELVASIKSKRNWSSHKYDQLQITNYWIKKLSTHFKGIAIALTEIINSERPRQQWLTEGKCLMIPKSANPTANYHRPITLLNTMYKAITPVIDNKLKDHQEQYKYMQIDQRGCSTGSMGCIDNLTIDKAILEDAGIRRKNIS